MDKLSCMEKADASYAELTLLLLLQEYLHIETFIPKELDFEKLYDTAFISFIIKTGVYDMDGNVELLFKWQQYKTRWNEMFMKRVRIFKALPNEILETIEDIRVFALGYQTQKTKARIVKYVQEKMRALGFSIL